MQIDRETIIKLAREAGFDPHDMSADFTCNIEDIARFAKLVAEHEREACAKYFEDHWRQEWTDEQIAAAIRARGQ